jgi:hypothetical protein
MLKNQFLFSSRIVIYVLKIALFSHMNCFQYIFIGLAITM